MRWDWGYSWVVHLSLSYSDSRFLFWKQDLLKLVVRAGDLSRLEPVEDSCGLIRSGT